MVGLSERNLSKRKSTSQSTTSEAEDQPSGVWTFRAFAQWEDECWYPAIVTPTRVGEGKVRVIWATEKKKATVGADYVWLATSVLKPGAHLLAALNPDDNEVYSPCILTSLDEDGLLSCVTADDVVHRVKFKSVMLEHDQMETRLAEFWAAMRTPIVDSESAGNEPEAGSSSSECEKSKSSDGKTDTASRTGMRDDGADSKLRNGTKRSNSENSKNASKFKDGELKTVASSKKEPQVAPATIQLVKSASAPVGEVKVQKIKRSMSEKNDLETSKKRKVSRSTVKPDDGKPLKDVWILPTGSLKSDEPDSDLLGRFKSCGGMVAETFEEFHDAKAKHKYMITSAPCRRTLKVFSSLMSGYPPVSADFLNHMVNSGDASGYKKFLLNTGVSWPDQDPIPWKRSDRSKLFADLHFVLLGTESVIVNASEILRMGGAGTVCPIKDNNDLDSLRVRDGTIFLTATSEKRVSKAALSCVEKNGGKLVLVEWVYQCAMEGKSLPFDEFLYDSSYLES